MGLHQDARWFTREEVAAAKELFVVPKPNELGGETEPPVLAIPGPYAIAHHLYVTIVSSRETEGVWLGDPQVVDVTDERVLEPPRLCGGDGIICSCGTSRLWNRDMCQDRLQDLGPTEIRLPVHKGSRMSLTPCSLTKARYFLRPVSKVDLI